MRDLLPSRVHQHANLSLPPFARSGRCPERGLPLVFDRHRHAAAWNAGRSAYADGSEQPVNSPQAALTTIGPQKPLAGSTRPLLDKPRLLSRPGQAELAD